MANTTLHWTFREVMAEFRDGGRLAVYLCYLLHANIRSRAWPSVATISKETGWSVPSVVEAKKWLVDRGALKSVPFSKRVEDEIALHPRVDIMEITGVVILDGKTIPILYSNEYTNTTVGSAGSSLNSTGLNNNIQLTENEGVVVGVGDNNSAERQQDDNPKLTNIIRVYERNIGPISELLLNRLEVIAEKYPDGWFEDATEIAVVQNARRLSYIEGILDKWQTNGKDAPKPNPETTPPPQYKRILT